jgi:hypothetical protein
MSKMLLQDLIQVWRLSEKFNSFHRAATDHDLEIAESKLGFRLPSVLRSLYHLSNGMELLEGNLQILPLVETDSKMGLSSASDKLRSWGCPIPDEVLVFGHNGADEQFGTWLPEIKGNVFSHPIVVIGEIFEPQCMAIEATGLIPFLLGWTAYYLMLYEAESYVLDALGLPQSLRFREDEMDENVFAKLRQWADPKLLDLNPDPYRHGLDGERLKKKFEI